MEDTAGQGSRFVCVSGPAASGHLSGSLPGPSHQHGYSDPCRSLFPPSSLLQAVRKAACVNHESDPGTPLLRTFERHSRETPRCSPINALVPTGRCACLGCASSLTSSPNRYGLPIAQVACALRCIPTCPCNVTSLPSDSVTALLVSLKSPPGWYLLLIRVTATSQNASPERAVAHLS